MSLAALGCLSRALSWSLQHYISSGSSSSLLLCFSPASSPWLLHLILTSLSSCVHHCITWALSSSCFLCVSPATSSSLLRCSPRPPLLGRLSSSPWLLLLVPSRMIQPWASTASGPWMFQSGGRRLLLRGPRVMEHVADQHEPVGCNPPTWFFPPSGIESKPDTPINLQQFRRLSAGLQICCWRWLDE